jgi:hypothetical protein
MTGQEHLERFDSRFCGRDEFGPKYAVSVQDR